jgi:sulfur carrier protein
MELIVNGEKTECSDGATVRELLEALEVSDEGAGVAVAVNEAVVPRAQWVETRLRGGDRVEVIHAVQGG